MKRTKRIRLIVAILFLIVSLTVLAAAFWPTARVRYILPLPPVSAPISAEFKSAGGIGGC
jgi:hypothetical protein